MWKQGDIGIISRKSLRGVMLFGAACAAFASCASADDESRLPTTSVAVEGALGAAGNTPIGGSSVNGGQSISQQPSGVGEYTTPDAKVIDTQNVGNPTVSRPFGGEQVLAADGCQTMYLMTTETGTSSSKSLAYYSSVDQATSWQRGGTIAIESGHCAQTMVALASTYNGSSQHRLLTATVSCNANNICKGKVYISDDGAQTWNLSGDATTAFYTDWCSSCLAVDDQGAVHIFYTANGTAAGQSNPNAVLQNISTNGGQTWGPSIKVATIDVLPRWPTSVAIGAKGSHRMLLFFEQQTADPNHRWAVGALASSDNGASWGPSGIALAPPADTTIWSPSAAVVDSQTLALTVQRSYLDNVSRPQVQLYFAPIPVSGLPTFSAATALSQEAIFPASIAAINDGNFLVVTGQPTNAGPILSRVRLQRSQ